ncbi:MAG: EAL domain-containing protein [Eubacterium sp.]
MGYIQVKSLLGKAGLLFRGEKNTLYQEPSFLQEWIRRDIFFCFSAAMLISLLALIGLVGTYAPHAKGAMWAKINATEVYLCLLAFNMFFAILFSTFIRSLSQEELENRKILAFLWIYRFIGMMLASLSFYSTVKGSSFFFEYIIITILIYLLPLSSFKESMACAGFNIAVMLFAVLNIRNSLAWQDWTDMFAFHMFCIIISQLRWNSYVRYESVRINLKKGEEQLSKEARTDGLTGLLNRTALREDFQDYLSRSISLAILDIDSFKKINDTYGHVFGDQILSYLGTELRRTFCRPDDRCYRYGGDEMMVISTEDGAAFHARLQKLQERCANRRDGMDVHVSIGYCTGTPLTEERLRACIRTADNCLYAAKRADKIHLQGKKLGAEHTDNLPLLDSLPSLDDLGNEFQSSGGRNDWSIVYFYIRQFADLNERIGYQNGRRALNKIAGIIHNIFDQTAMLTWEGDHFILYVLLPEWDTLEKLKKVQDQVSTQFSGWVITLNIGMDFHSGSSGEQFSFIRSVYNAKYACEQLRKNPSKENIISIYDEEMDKIRRRDHFIRNHLKEAIKNGDIRPYYQPFVGSLSEKTCGFEALARWEDPEKGLLSPAMFIPYLEEKKEMYLLDLYILRCVCEDLKNHPQMASPDIFITVNLSRTDFEMRNMPEEIDKILDHYEFPKSQIQFEITESGLGADTSARKAVAEMARRGYKIWLDDFGIGQSSLYALKDYNIQGIKLDNSFLINFRDNKRTHAVIRSIVDLCHTAGCLMIAEGVEDVEQFWYARQWGVNFIQGFYFSRPMPVHDLLQSSFLHNLTDDEDVRLYRPAANINLRQAMEENLYRGEYEKLVYAKAVLKRENNRLYFIRMNGSMLQLISPYIRQKDLNHELTADKAVKSTMIHQMNRARQQKDVVDFRLSLNREVFHGQLALLSELAGKSIYVFTLSNFGLVNPIHMSGKKK